MNTTTSITGTKTVHYDSNSGRNVMAIEHNNEYYLHSRNNSTVPNSIKSHILEQAQDIANNNITLLSIGFGEQNQLDMNLLTELSTISNGKAVRASGDNIVEIFEEVSANISAVYPSLSNGFIKFKLPSGVIVQQNDQVTQIDDYAIMNLNNIKYNPNPPNAGDSSLHYELPLTFTTKGVYNFSFDVLYNSGTIFKNGLSYTVEVYQDLQQINFRPKERITIGERMKVEDYLSFTPSEAKNNNIKLVESDNPSVIGIEKVASDWYIVGKSIGNSNIKVKAEKNYPTIFDTERIEVYQDKLQQIDFRPNDIKVGERIKVSDNNLKFYPDSAINKNIELIVADDPSVIGIEKIGSDWYIVGKSIGYSNVKAIAEENYPNIFDSKTISVKENEAGNTGLEDYKW
jgi:hypothetical protein